MSTAGGYGGRVSIKTYRGPSKGHGYKSFAPWGIMSISQRIIMGNMDMESNDHDGINSSIKKTLMAK